MWGEGYVSAGARAGAGGEGKQGSVTSGGRVNRLAGAEGLDLKAHEKRVCVCVGTASPLHTR